MSEMDITGLESKSYNCHRSLKLFFPSEFVVSSYVIGLLCPSVFGSTPVCRRRGICSQGQRIVSVGPILQHLMLIPLLLINLVAVLVLLIAALDN